MSVHYEDSRVTLHHGDCLDVLRSLPDASVDSICTDPPYGLGFMGKAWDDLPPGREWATECLRVLKPGGHLLAFGGTRTWHRLACAVEDAGFEVRDSIAWLYGSGFPKSLDVSKAIDKAAGAEREAVQNPRASQQTASVGRGATIHVEGGDFRHLTTITPTPATDDARTWQGWGTALKPAFEPVVVARKPLVGTVAANVLTHGTGALNVDGCRIEGVVPSVPQPDFRHVNGVTTHLDAHARNGQMSSAPGGRWPANVILDEDMAAVLDEQSGTSLSQGGSRGAGGQHGAYSPIPAQPDVTPGYGDKGGASRFFYVAKAPKRERPVVDGVAHPTVKPLALMRWLVRLVTPPGGTVLEPFAGSGTTVEACLREGFRCIAIEKGDEYLPLIVERIARQDRAKVEAEVVRTVDVAQAIAEQVAGQLDIFGEATA